MRIHDRTGRLLGTGLALAMLLAGPAAAQTRGHPADGVLFPTPDVERAVRYSALWFQVIPAAGDTTWTKLACCLACIASDGPDPTDGLTCTWCWFAIEQPPTPFDPPVTYIPYDVLEERVARVLPATARGHGFEITRDSPTSFTVTNTGDHEDTAIVSALEYGIPMHPGRNLEDARIVEPKGHVLWDMAPGESRRVVLRPRAERGTGFMVGVVSAIAFDMDGNGMAGLITAPPSGPVGPTVE